MGNKATNIEAQISRLEERGMVLDLPKQKIEEILLDIGYYRLGFYWHPFETDNKHNLIAGTKFSDIVSLYYLDVNLRNILIRTLNRIEINFRTKLIYFASNKYPNSSTWFVDKKVMKIDFINNFDKFYSKDFVKNNAPIKNHHKKYINDKYAPAWKTLEFFTFGTILKIYKNLIDSDLQNEISQQYGIKDTSRFINLLNTIVHIRNVCAHGGVLFDLNIPKQITVLPFIPFNKNNRNSIDSCIRVILYFTQIISNNRKNEIVNELNLLFEENSKVAIVKGIIENEINFVKNY